MKIIFRLIGVGFLAVLFSCGGESSDGKKGTEASADSLYGGVLRQSENEIIQSLFPPAIGDAVSYNIASQIYEGLVKFNAKTLALEPSVAEKWELDSAGTTYTFYLKKGVYFHDNLCFQNNKGRTVTAKDFKFCFEQLCSATPNNINFQSSFKDKVIGANKYYEESISGKPKNGLEGVEVVDDHKLRIKLISRDNSFLYLLANPYTAVYPKEAVDLYNEGVKVGTGPFVFEEGKFKEDLIVLSRNPNYHRKDAAGNTLPYLDSVMVYVFSDKQKEMQAFKDGKLDFIIGLPSEAVSDVVQKDIAKFRGDSAQYVLDRMPEMLTQFYEFNTAKPPFNNLKVRQAFSYAIDRQKLVDEILNSEAYGPGENGICPPAFPGYDITKVKGYNFNPEKAKKLLAEAGYPGGKGFPKVKLELNSGGKKHTNVSLEIQEQIMSVLGVSIDIEVVPFSKKLDDAKFGRSNMTRSGWIADYPDPESFLIVLNGSGVPDDLSQPSYPNSMRYKNAEFDKLFKEAKTAPTKEKSYEKYLQAEQIAMNDAPIMVLWYEESYRLARSYLKNFYNNPMRYKDYSVVYIEKNKN